MVSGTASRPDRGWNLKRSEPLANSRVYSFKRSARTESAAMSRSSHPVALLLELNADYDTSVRPIDAISKKTDSRALFEGLSNRWKKERVFLGRSVTGSILSALLSVGQDDCKKEVGLTQPMRRFQKRQTLQALAALILGKRIRSMNSSPPVEKPTWAMR